MKIIVATHRQQGEVDGDYCWAVEGEVVTPVVAMCSSPASCGCSRGFPGLASSRATTTAEVVDLAHLQFGDLARAVRDSLERSGWLAGADEFEADELVSAHVGAIIAVGALHPVGTVLRRNGDSVFSCDSRAA